jgi:hypothetical protein
VPHTPLDVAVARALEELGAIGHDAIRARKS